MGGGPIKADEGGSPPLLFCSRYQSMLLGRELAAARFSERHFNFTAVDEVSYPQFDLVELVALTSAPPTP